MSGRLNHELKHPVVKTDGSEKLEDLVEDIYRSFCFTGSGVFYQEEDKEMYRHIYESKLPESTEVHQYHTGMVCQGVVEILETSTKVGEPKNYYELFEIIGVSCEYQDEIYVDKYLIWQYPDSVILDMKAEGNKLFFGYGR